MTQIEGDPDSPVSRGRLCPKGAASKQLVTPLAGRRGAVPAAVRHASGSRWTWTQAMDMIADRLLAARRGAGRSRRTASRCGARLGIASLGGATLDNEENYLIKKLWTALGAIQIENQARI